MAIAKTAIVLATILLSGCARPPAAETPARPAKPVAAALEAKSPPAPDPKIAARREQNDRIREADRLNREGKHRAAKEILTEVLAQAPDRAELLLRLGNTELYLDNVDDALTAFETAYHLGAENKKLPLSIAELWVRIGELDEAVAWIERASERSPNDPSLLLRKAQILVVHERVDEAQAIAGQLIDHQNREVARGALVLLGYAALSAGDEELATKHWEAAAGDGKVGKEVLSFLAHKNYERGHYEAAAKHFSAYVDLAGDESMHRHLVLSLRKSGQLVQARDELLRYLEKYPDSPHASSLASAVDAADDTTAMRHGE